MVPVLVLRYGKHTLTGKVLDVTAGTVDGSLAINVISNDTLTDFARFEGSVGTTFNNL